MERGEQRQAPHVSDEELAPGPQYADGAGEHGQQVLERGEVLDDRVDDDPIELAGREAGEVVGQPVQEGHVGEPGQAPAALLEVPDRLRREVGPAVGADARRDARQEEPGPGADLEHVPGPPARMRSTVDSTQTRISSAGMGSPV